MKKEQGKKITAEQALQSIKNAWLIEGPAPSIHHQEQERLKRNWPTLYYAIMEVINL